MKFTNNKDFNSFAQEYWTQLRLQNFIWQTLAEAWTFWVLNFLVDKIFCSGDPKFV